MSASPDIESPCTKVCTLDADGRLCLGCFRDIDEIGGWGGMSNAQRADVIARTAARRARFESDGTRAASPAP